MILHAYVLCGYTTTRLTDDRMGAAGCNKIPMLLTCRRVIPLNQISVKILARTRGEQYTNFAWLHSRPTNYKLFTLQQTLLSTRIRPAKKYKFLNLPEKRVLGWAGPLLVRGSYVSTQSTQRSTNVVINRPPAINFNISFIKKNLWSLLFLLQFTRFVNFTSTRTMPSWLGL